MYKQRTVTMPAIFLILFALFILPMQTASAATSPVERSAVDAGLAEAQSLVQAGKMQDAYRLYFTLLREDPENDTVLLGLARTAIATGHPNQAIMAYETLIARHPEAGSIKKWLRRI